jgi:hypothetical protein
VQKDRHKGEDRRDDPIAMYVAVPSPGFEEGNTPAARETTKNPRITRKLQVNPTSTPAIRPSEILVPIQLRITATQGWR